MFSNLATFWAIFSQKHLVALALKKSLSGAFKGFRIPLWSCKFLEYEYLIHNPNIGGVAKCIGTNETF
jgi:hypothetical protein